VPDFSPFTLSCLLEPIVGFEPTTARLRIECSTPELHWQIRGSIHEAIRLINTTSEYSWWPGAGLNRRHYDFQSYALPTELPSRNVFVGEIHESPLQKHFLATRTRFELATFCVTGRYANRYTTEPDGGILSFQIQPRVLRFLKVT
jgi:hypothetical protein